MAGSSNKVFVGGLPQGCTDGEFEDFFTKFGKITDVVVMKDRDTGNTRGFGFVTFDNTDAVDEVMEQYKDHQIRDKWVEVKRATPKGQGDSKGDHGSSGGKGSDRSDFRPGDWTCPSCRQNVFASKDVCFKCQTPKPRGRDDYDRGDRGFDRGHGSDLPPAYGGAYGGGGKGGGSGGSGGGDRREGDWTCPRCFENVFASKDVCFKCDTPKPRGGGGAGYGSYGGYGDYGGAGAYAAQAFGGAYAAQAFGGAYGPYGGFGGYGVPPGYGAYGHFPSSAYGAPGAYGGGGGKGYSPY